jgi:WD40 repeat protein
VSSIILENFFVSLWFKHFPFSSPILYQKSIVFLIFAHYNAGVVFAIVGEMHMGKRFWIMLALLWIASFTMAQGLPSQVDAALADLSSRVGREITLTNNTLTNWQWSQDTFNDTSLGCPVAGESYAQVITPGYIFILEYAGVIYEYHVSQDASNVRLCNQRSTGEPTPTPPVEEQFSNPLCPAPSDTSGAYPRTYVQPEMPVVGTLTVNRLRQTPATDAAILMEIPNGAVFVTVSGPECDDEGIVWWQVDYDGALGWTAEAQGNERYFVPQPPNALPERNVIAVDNVAQMSLLATIEANIQPVMAWSQNNLLAVAGDVGANGVFVYSMSDLSQPFVIERDEIVTAIDFIPNNQQLLVGTDAGSVHIWNVVTTVDTPFVESLFLQTHAADIAALAASPTETLFASAGFEAATNADIDRENAVVLANYETVQQERVFEQFAPVVDLEFSADGARLAVVENAGGLYVWDVAAAAGDVPPVNGAYTSVDVSRNSQFIAVGGVDGAITIFDTRTLEVLATLTGHLREVSDISFSPDSTLIASISVDGTLRLWNTQSDENVAVVELNTVEVQSVAFSPDGTLLAVALVSNQIVLYGVANP